MSKALDVYRTLLRSITTAFRGDASMLESARQEIRSKFKEAASLTDQQEISRRFAEGEEAADFIRTYVVQAKLNERGNFAMQVQPEHADTTAEEDPAGIGTVQQAVVSVN
ncbi:hypothetical protein WJX72_008604 [[Myrmecia] bisecta]|uniref:Complex 1 LYR protein domain-containing protein n=1 Tax=[Myrmecia] bisecta TaxID=41462 RepID=A0AAW1R8G4_9CHLO